jgi:hypothetical protein
VKGLGVSLCLHRSTLDLVYYLLLNIMTCSSPTRSRKKGLGVHMAEEDKSISGFLFGLLWLLLLVLYLIMHDLYIKPELVLFGEML